MMGTILNPIDVLTPRELEAGKLLSEGSTNKDIALALGICVTRHRFVRVA